jgi:hypothetical protein
MADPAVVADVMSPDFAVVQAGTGEVPSGRPVVLVDGREEPVGVVGPSGAGPAWLVDADAELSSLARAESVLSALMEGASVLIAVRAGRPVGVVSVEAVKAEVVRVTRDPDGVRLNTDFQPYGHAGGAEVTVRVECAICGTTNVFDRGRRFSRAKTYRCDGGDHDLVPQWGA